jgi:hypothetical protein
LSRMAVLPSLRALPLNAITFILFILLPCESMVKRIDYFGRNGEEYPQNRRSRRHRTFFAPRAF